MLMFLQVVFIILCVLLMGVIMIQQRKSGGFSGSFGGGSQPDMSGGSWQRMTSATKLTVVLAALFMICAIVLVIMTKTPAA